jgi:hypothetical protein
MDDGDRMDGETEMDALEPALRITGLPAPR